MQLVADLTDYSTAIGYLALPFALLATFSLSMLLRYTLLVGAACLLSGACFGQNITFQLPSGLRTAPVTGKPYHLITADFNGDGNPDIAATCEEQNVVSLTLSQSKNTFAPAVAYAVQRGPQSLISADLNADGRPDLVVGNVAAGSLSVLLNRGNGTFGLATSLGAGLLAGPTHLLAGDFTSDGITDIVVGSTLNGSVQVFTGNNTGTLTALPTMGGLAFQGIASADYDRDGRLDLLLSQPGTPVSSIRPLYGLGNGTFTFGVSSALPAATYGTELLATDLNQDGKIDLAQLDPYLNEVLVFMSGSAGLAPGVHLRVGSKPTALHAADLDGDSLPELLVVNEVSNNVTVLPGLATGYFGPARNYLTSGGPKDVVVADFTGDSRPDLLSADAASTGQHNLTLMPNAGNGLLQNPSSANLSHYGSRVTLADLNGDGLLDAAVAGEAPSGGGDMSVLFGRGNGHFGPARAWGTSGLGPGWIVARDITGDNRPEILVTHYSNSTFTLYTNDGLGGFPTRSTQWIPRMGNGIGGVTTADFNSDGHYDVAVAGAETTYNNFGVDLFLNKDGQLDAPIFLPTGSFPHSIEAADVDRDGRPDLVMTFPLYNASTVGVLRNMGNNTFAPLVSYPTPNQTQQVLVVDVNGDQWPDLLVRTDNAVQLRLNLAGTGFGTAQMFTTAPNSSKVQAADLNGDGLLDLLVCCSGIDRLQVFQNVNNTSFTALPEIPLFGYGWDMAVGPLNGDALPDLVSVDLDGNSVVAFLNTSRAAPLAAQAAVAPTSWTAYPNPATSHLYLPALSTTSAAMATLFDSRGTQVGQWPLNTTGVSSLPVNHLARGLYFLRLLTPEGKLLAAQQLVLQ